MRNLTDFSIIFKIRFNIEIAGSSRPLVHHVAPIINLSIAESRVYRCRCSSRHISPDILFVAEQLECIDAANSLGSRRHIDIFIVAGPLDIVAVVGHIDIVAIAVNRWSSRDKLDNNPVNNDCITLSVLSAAD
ncbi:hypothetical protein Hanom_Chr04g00310461 [Helianthus anomalus]